MRDCGLERWSSIPGIANIFSFLHSVKTCSEAHLASYKMGSGVKRAGREADHSPSSMAEFKNGGAIPPLPHTSSWRGA
jgi:hypothetical protein